MPLLGGMPYSRFGRGAQRCCRSTRRKTTEVGSKADSSLLRLRTHTYSRKELINGITVRAFAVNYVQSERRLSSFLMQWKLLRVAGTDVFKKLEDPSPPTALTR